MKKGMVSILGLYVKTDIPGDRAFWAGNISDLLWEGTVRQFCLILGLYRHMNVTHSSCRWVHQKPKIFNPVCKPMCYP